MTRMGIVQKKFWSISNVDYICSYL